MGSNHISKFLSLILRHKPEVIGITLDSNGWVDVDVLLAALEENGKRVTLEDLKEVVSTDSKGRYSFSDDGKMIRANQGHSLKTVDLELKPLLQKDLPTWLYHGTPERFKSSILKEGLKPMSRQFVHLSDNIETAKQVGDRRKKDNQETVIFKISTIEAMNQGVEFFKSENGVYLAKKIPSELLR